MSELTEQRTAGLTSVAREARPGSGRRAEQRAVPAATPPLPLSVLILTRDEERDLPTCLASVAGLAAEVVVLDSGSTDATLTIARQAGARVHSRPFTGYASQRTAALALARHDWVLFLDADERLTPAGRAEISAILAGGAAPTESAPVGYWLPRHNEFFGRRVRSGGWWPDAQLRLFRRDRARYNPERQVHETVELDGPAGRLSEPLIHRNYDSWAEFHAKQNAYATHHARDLARRGVRPRPWTYLTQPAREFLRRYVALGAWREGWLGCQLAAALAWYEALAHLRLRRLPRAAEAPRESEMTVQPFFAAPATLDLSVVVVSHNTRDLLRRCLASVAASLAGSGLTGEIIVVDNASTDGSPAMVRADYPDAQLIEAGANRGFAAGNNLGLRAARGRALLLLNSDAELIGEALPILLDTLDADPTAAIVGPALRYPNGAPQSSRRRFPTRVTPFLESTLVQQYWRRNRQLSRYYVNDLPDDAPHVVDWLTGACLLVRRAAVAQCGGLDEAFFMYSEELEWCWRLRRAGWRVRYEPAAKVLHHEGASSSDTSPARQIRFNASKVLLYRRVFGPWYAEVLRAFLLATFVAQVAREGAKWLVGHRRPLRRQRLATYLAVLRSGLRAGAAHRTAALPATPANNQ